MNTMKKLIFPSDVANDLLWSVDELSGNTFTISKTRQGFRQIFSNIDPHPQHPQNSNSRRRGGGGGIHVKSGTHASTMYVPVYYSASHPSSALEVQGTAAVFFSKKII